MVSEYKMKKIETEGKIIDSCPFCSSINFVAEGKTKKCLHCQRSWEKWPDRSHGLFYGDEIRAVQRTSSLGIPND